MVAAGTVTPGATAEEKGALTARRGALRLLLGSPSALAGVILVLGVVLAAVFAPWVATHEPSAQILADQLQPPGAKYLLGTDQLGRDIFSRIVWGARISLRMGILAVAIGLALGLVVGFLSGFIGGWADMLLMRLVDILLSFPLYLLAILVMAILGPSLTNAMIAVGIATFPHIARLVRGETLAVKEREFVEAARGLGADYLRLGTRHIIPQIMGPLVVLATFRVATAIVVESSLSFLGLGPPPPTPAWGLMIAEGQQVLEIAPWVSVIPGAAIMVLVMGFNLAGDALRDVLDPRLRGSAPGKGAEEDTA
ncbi:MAG: ABC transporter permease [Candidatus Tectomicrobia bacterium]|uniref:ABC transporter permease n=1 Tax=Tectimicrobiota bacterium TaxID=2528274 RepID=A0A932MMD7_UNCTE|nr:ABC transporter permease [Candidatus Tectomicrobia bacterium]